MWSKSDQAEFAEAVREWMLEKLELEWDDDVDHDDWTLIVKLHAKIETGLTGSILRELDRPKLGTLIAKLDTSNQSTGKAAFARELGILDKPSPVFLQKLSELRNICVHDIRNFKFNLGTYFSAIGQEKQRDIMKAIKNMAKPDSISTPQEGLIVGTMAILSELMVHEEKCKSRDAKSDLQRIRSELLLVREESKAKES